jgi:hypothetical protein
MSVILPDPRDGRTGRAATMPVHGDSAVGVYLVMTFLALLRPLIHHRRRSSRAV